MKWKAVGYDNPVYNNDAVIMQIEDGVYGFKIPGQDINQSIIDLDARAIDLLEQEFDLSADGWHNGWSAQS